MAIWLERLADRGYHRGNPMADVTQLLNAVRAEDLLPLVYDELRQLAGGRLAREQPGQTLQPTALGHEAWLRLAESGDAQWSSRVPFFGAFGEAMRRILVDNARRKAQLKRGGNPERVDLPESQIADALELNEKTIRRHWEVAKVRLFELITSRNPPAGGH